MVERKPIDRIRPLHEVLKKHGLTPLKWTEGHGKAVLGEIRLVQKAFEDFHSTHPFNNESKNTDLTKLHNELREKIPHFLDYSEFFNTPIRVTGDNFILKHAPPAEGQQSSPEFKTRAFLAEAGKQLSDAEVEKLRADLNKYLIAHFTNGVVLQSTFVEKKTKKLVVEPEFIFQIHVSQRIVGGKQYLLLFKHVHRELEEENEKKQ
ncbi:hypothetical protein HY993_04990 [Candidatus Micrarchaeota archaeon]|nr:hypothetical protein [Candidatus Micrarchaeota archaeon]